MPHFPKTDAFIQKPDGPVFGPVPATFTGGTILIEDDAVNIAEGDTVIRKLPNGNDDKHYVTKVNFYPGGNGVIGSHYQIEFTKTMHTKSPPQINIHTAQAVQIGDNNTQNIANAFEALIKNIDNSNASPAQKEEAKSLLKQFLGHPLVSTLVGAGVTALLGG
ncbi:RIP homotypic interaction motif-containing protein [Chromobacterium piscinae]|uniref:RIP homotypic interaction motif-containing protein n=1 Tax=Chromobacterium piscinae TaxID=686831 RepID=UPI001E3B41E0|nr:RIP homotypic interaction motif-containing protein [Chromobacterium piscinae]MCD5327859.1 hypothetical protein [Chromobacterium piscinae]